MSLATTISAMVAAGCTPQQIEAVVLSHEFEQKQRLADKRAKDAERQRKSRMSRNVTVTECDSQGQGVTASRDIQNAPTHAEPEPNITTYPTTSEAKASSVEPQQAEVPLTGEILTPSPSPKPSPPASTRGCRLPPGFPGDAEREWAKQNLGYSDDDFDECAAEFRDYWSGVSGRHGVKCDWPATFRNAARKYRPRSRPRQAYAAGNQRSDGSLLGAYQRAAARVRAANDVPRERPGVFDSPERELGMRYGIPAE